MLRAVLCCAWILAAAASARAITLNAGDLLVADAGASGGSVIRVDPLTGAQQTVVSGLGDVRGVAVTPTGSIYAATQSAVLRVDPATMTATSVGTGFSDLQGIATDGAGQVYLVDKNAGGPSVLRLDPSSSSVTALLVGDTYLSDPTDIVLNGSGVIYVSDLAGGSLTPPASVISINASVVSLVTFLDNLSVPLGLAADASGGVLVANALPASLVGVDAHGSQTLISSGGMMRDTVAVAASSFGVFVADRGDSSHPASILEILSGGSQQEISAGNLLTQTGLVDLDVYPVPEPRTAVLLVLGIAGFAILRSSARGAVV